MGISVSVEDSSHNVARAGTMQKLRLVVAEDDPQMRECLCILLKEEHEIIGTFADGVEVLEQARVLQPDMLLLDISMPRLSGLKVARQLRQEHISTKIIIVSEHADHVYVDEARRIGVQGYVLKRNAWTDLPKALRVVESGEFFVSDAIK